MRTCGISYHSMNILFVCLGNICRSPLAEAVFTDLVRREGLSDSVTMDSAGTAGYHEGETADQRALSCARRHGLEITHRARALVQEDFVKYDWLVAMDGNNSSEMRRRAPDAASRRKICHLRDWDPAGPGEVPDPYSGNDADFEFVWHLCDRSLPGLLNHALSKEKR